MSFPAPADAKDSRVWIDGCFDFAHHGHAGAMLQARSLGKELYVGVHSDEEILKNKGPTVMSLDERLTAVEACKWCTKPVGDAPYVTSPEFMDKYGCKYAVHGDDITTDANGEDCYKIVKDLGRFIVVKRTPSISTTDLVGRMLLYTKTHHLPELSASDLKDKSGALLSPENLAAYKSYATDATGLHAGSAVSCCVGNAITQIIEPSLAVASKLAKKIYYVQGTFDLFHPGHIKFLQSIYKLREAEEASDSIAIVVGITSDKETNTYKGLNYPIMSIFERSLCVLQCQYVDAIVLGAPYTNNVEYLHNLGNVIKVFTGPVFTTSYQGVDFFSLEKEKGILHEINDHEYSSITTEVIVSRVLDNRVAYEERQRKKGWKNEKEKVLEAMEKSSST